MEVISIRISSSEQLNNLENTCVPVIKNYPKLNYFNDYIHLDSIECTLFEFIDGSKIVVLGERIGNTLVFNPRAFVNSVYATSLKKPLDFYLTKIIQYIGAQGIDTIRFRTPPSFVQEGQEMPIISYRETRGFTSVVEVQDFKLSNRRKRLIEKASKVGFSFEVSSPENWEETWEFLEEFLLTRRLPSIGKNRVLNLVANFSTHFQLVRVMSSDSKVIGAALINRIGNAIRIPNYFGDKSFDGSTDFLIFKVIGMASNENYKYVDLGFSTDPTTGHDVEGIVNFKSEFSAFRQELFEDVIIF